MSVRRTLNLVRLETRITPASLTWDGSGANSFWSTPQNWVGDVAPQPGDDLAFPAGAAQLTNLNNFAAGTQFHLILLTGSGYAIGGNPIALTTGVFANIASGADILAVSLGGSGGMIKIGQGTLVLPVANTFTGLTQVFAGVLDVRDGDALGASGVGSETSISGGTLAVVGVQSINNPNATTIIPESVLFSGNGAIGGDGQPLGAIRGQQGEPVFFTGPLTLANGGGSITAGVLSQILVTTSINEIPAPPSGGLVLSGIVNITDTATVSVTSIVQGTGDTILNGQISSGSFSFSPNAIVPGRLEGVGSLGPIAVNFGGTLAPGQINGMLTTGDLSMSGDSVFQTGVSNSIFGYTASKAAVHGSVHLSGARLAVTGNDMPLSGSHFTIIDNDGTDPIVGQFSNGAEGAIVGVGPGFGLRITYHGGDGNDVDLVVDPTGALAFAVGAGKGGAPVVGVYAGNGSLLRSFLAFDPSFRGGVRVSTGDFNLDGIPDIVTAAGPGALPEIRVYDGRSAAIPAFPGFGFPNGGLLGAFLAYDPRFQGGVFVATGDVTGDGHPDIIAGAGAGGGPHVKVFAGLSSDPIASYFAYDSGFTGGVSVAVGDVDGDGHAEVITGAGAGGGLHAKVLNGLTGAVVTQFFAYESTFTGGVYVATADVDGDHKAEVVIGTGAGGGPLVKTFNGRTGALLASFFAYDENFRGGVTVVGADLDADGHDEILTGAGPGGGPHVEAWDLPGPTGTVSLIAFDPAFIGGVYVG